VFAAAAGQAAADFNGFIDTARTQGNWGILLYHSILPTANNWVAGVAITDITASIGHAKLFGDVWIDRMDEIGAYVRAQQIFQRVTLAANTWTWTLPAHFPPGKVLRVTVDGGTLNQLGTAALTWDSHGYYQVALDAGTLRWTP
jgi:hypothetical protein